MALPPTDRRLVAEAAMRLLLAKCALRLLPFARVAATLANASAKPFAMTPDGIRKIRWAVESAAHHLPLSLTCLPQALAASWMLKARGGTPRMLYGVARKETGGFEAHAWVELDGVPVIGHRAAPRFTLLASFPQKAANS